MSNVRLPTKERREQLAEAALRLLSSQGARALTVKAIAEEVGITDGAVFRHFKNKQALFEAALLQFESYLTAPPSSDLPPVERLGRFFTDRVLAVRARPEILSLAFNDRLQEVLGSEGAERIRAQTQLSMRFIQGCVQKAQEKGELPPDVNPHLVSLMVTGVLRGAVQTTSSPQGSRPPKEIWDEVKRILFVTMEPT